MNIQQLPLYILTVAVVLAAIFIGGQVLSTSDPAGLADEVGYILEMRR